MAVTYETSLAPQSVSFLAAGEAETVAFDAGTGSDRILIVVVTWRDRSNTISGVTYNGVAMTSAGAKVNNGSLSGQLWYLAGPASGSNNIVVTMGAGAADSAAHIAAWVANSVDSGTPVDGYVSANGSGSTANIVSDPGTITSATGDGIFTAHATWNVSGNIAATASGYTERQDAANGGGLSTQFGDAAGAATVDATATWDNGAFAVSWVAFGININQVAAGSTAVPVFIHNLKVQGIL